MNYPVRIFIIEDHPLVRLGLEAVLKREKDKFDVVGVADCAKAFWDSMPVKADVLLLDIILPDETGVDIARKLRNDQDPVKILVLSAETDKETISELMRIGIQGFVNKTVPAHELMTAIEYVADGLEYFGRDISKIMRDIRIAKNNVRINFTGRENEILTLCTQGFSAKEISSKLNISIHTVNTHKDSIFKKLGINSSIELVRWAIDHGVINL